jgi:uncharacterized protein YutE (UPF0331/DUF86 family)
VSPPDKDVVRRKLTRIVKCLARIARIRSRTVEEYTADEDLQAVMERQLELLVGAAVDCNVHILVQSGQAAPADAYTSFLEVARDASAFDLDLAARLAPSAGLRNRLAHVYEDLDPTLVYAGLHEALDLYPRYVQSIEAYLERA